MPNENELNLYNFLKKILDRSFNKYMKQPEKIAYKFRLLKDMPGLKAGRIFRHVSNDNNLLAVDDYGGIVTFTYPQMINLPDWFEPIYD
jgi:hypothetical protein